MDRSTRELREAHDVLAEVYAERLVDILDSMPHERAVLDLFCRYVREHDSGVEVADVGCGTGRLSPYFLGQDLQPFGVDLSPEMIRVAHRDFPDFPCEVGDLRALPYDDATLAGAVGWYSLMYLDPEQRPLALAEIARVVKPGGYLAVAFKAGDSTHRRGGARLGLGIEFDIYWLSPDDMAAAVTDAGFEVVFWAGRPADPDELQPQGYLIARRTST